MKYGRFTVITISKTILWFFLSLDRKDILQLQIVRNNLKSTVIVYIYNCLAIVNLLAAIVIVK